MSERTAEDRGTASAPAVADAGAVSPFLHDRGQSLYNPLTGLELSKASEGFQALSRIERGLPPGVDAALLDHLRAGRFLIEDIFAESRRTHLLYVSLETCTACNHRCPFCPVSVAPRDKEVMTQELFESIVDQIAEFGGDGVVVSLSNYNEPTFDPLFEDRIRYLFRRKIPVSILTNASGFTPERSALFESLGRFRYIGVNMPTLRADRYEKLHGTRDLPRVIANMDAMHARDLSEETAIVALGPEDEEHLRDVAEIREHFEPKGWVVKQFKIRSRPGSGTYVVEPPPLKKLRGCDLLGSRPFEHLHVTGTGTAVLCCQDYYEKLTIGDLKTQSVAEILGGDTIAQLRRWAYGVEEAPEDFLCRRCEFAIPG
ncbi:MAG TPA: radical SAM/SPASM domain-containing protein [Thermoanaerobaculia bacterium]